MKHAPERYRPFAGGYVSEHDQFMATLLGEHPEVEQDRQRGWDIWWDHRVDLDELALQRKSAVPVKPYQYE
jgi:hypothetical protein